MSDQCYPSDKAITSSIRRLADITPPIAEAIKLRDIGKQEDYCCSLG